MITLYHCNTSLASYKVRLYLAEKNLPWKSVHVDLRKQEHITSDYRNINPRGLVPSLKNEQDEIIINSTDIIEYLEATYPEPSLLPNDPNDQQLIHDLCKEHEALHDPHLRMLSYYVVFMNPSKQVDTQRIIKMAHSHPSPERGKFLERAAKQDFSAEEITNAKQAVIKALQHLEKLLQQSNSSFLVGATYSYADAVCTASLFRITEVGMQEEIEKLPALKQWWQAMQARPSFKTAITDLLP